MCNCIKIENITKKFKESTVLDNVSINFPKGKISGIVGRNGAGKTMLMKCICGFVIPNSGTVHIFDKIVGKHFDVPDNVGILIETPGFLNDFNAYNNLKFLADIKGKISKEKIKETIEYVGLDSNSKKHVGKFSLGMKQRLGIAQAIMEDPEILILDEPMNGLDNQGVKDVRKMLLELKEQGKTIILASHSKEDIEMLCDNTIEMDHGKIIKRIQNNRAL